MSKIIPKDRLSAVQRWSMPSVDDVVETASDAASEPVRKPEAPSKPPAFPTLEEIETIQREAQEEGYTAGLEEGREQGHREGLEAGRKAGLKAGRKAGLDAGRGEIEARVRDLDSILNAMAAPLKELDTLVEEELVRLTTAIARRLIRRELKTAPGEIVAVVREAVALLPVASQGVALHLHPEDARLVREALALDDEQGRAWTLIEDPALSRGGCAVESELSRIDATVERRLNTVIATVLGDQRTGERDDD